MNNATETSALSGDGGPASAHDLVGRTLGDFRVLRRLGQGGMGQVYLAEQLSLNRMVALKILRPELMADGPALQRFEREAKAVARATHANIVQVYAAGVTEGVAYMALEYVEGRNLRDYLARKGTPDVLIVLSIMRQVAAALQRAAELGIIHRDIKPENILLTRKGEVKVADFGLARSLEGDQPALNLTQSGVAMGTPLYMSPEQVEGKPLDPRTDIYSFGATCYHMIAGQPPFTGTSAFQVAWHHVHTEPAALRTVRPDLPEALCVIVHKMMAKLPEQRYQTGKDLLRDLARLREGLGGATAAVSVPTIQVEPVAVSTATPAQPQTTTFAPPSTKGGDGRRGLAVAVLATLLLAGVAGALFAWVERRRSGPLPRAGVVLPADASTVEALSLAHRKEQALREAAEQYLGQGANGRNVATGFGLCLDLGVFYLEEDRLDEAERLFTRLSALREPESYQLLGNLGQAIVLALRNKATESGKVFHKTYPRLNALLRLGKAPGRRPGPDPQALQLAQNQQWRYWLLRARWFNKNNGVDLPAHMLRHPLLGGEGGGGGAALRPPPGKRPM